MKQNLHVLGVAKAKCWVHGGQRIVCVLLYNSFKLCINFHNNTFKNYHEGYSILYSILRTI